MCPHPFASLDCAAVYALLAVPGAAVALVFALSVLLRWRPSRSERSRTSRWVLSLLGAVPTSFAAAVLAAWVFMGLGLFRAHLDERLVMLGLLALTAVVESLYLLVCRPRRAA